MSIRTIIQGAILTAFFVSTLWLVAGLPVVFNSPDESANFNFASEVALNRDLVIEEPRNEVLGGILHPRSILTVGDRLLPRSFLGLPVLFGVVGMALGVDTMLYVTPLLAVLTILAWGSTVNIVFRDRTLAAVAGFLLMIHPAFWYYTGRTMMHNVGFVSFLVFSVWFLAYKPFQRWKNTLSWTDALMAGAMAAVAIAFRSAEVVWVVPLGLMLLWWSNISWKQFFLFCLGFFIAIAPFAIMNDGLYGSFSTTGYQVTAESTPTVQSSTEVQIMEDSEQVSGPSAFDKIMTMLFPFGIAETAIVRHAWQYGVALYPWMTSVFAIGMLMVFVKRKQLDHKKTWEYLLSVLITLSIWLVVVYGSWTFHDNPDPNIFSLGNSYVRYWIPLFLLATPFGAFAIVKSTQAFKRLNIQRAVLVGVLAVLFLLSANLVFFGDDGFIPTRRALVSFDEKREQILEVTEDDAIIIVDRADKFLFPHRAVVVPLRNESTYAAMPSMVDQAPLYYFGITFPDSDIEYLNDVKLATHGLRIEAVETINDETLYRISHD